MRQDLGPHLAPSVVPWTVGYEIDEEEFCRHVRYLADVSGVSSVVVNAHAGEVFSLSIDERCRLASLAVEEVGGRTRVISGLQAFPETNQAAIEFAKRAEQLGVDGLLVSPPSWFSFGVAEVEGAANKYVEGIAEASDLPIVLFQLPPWTGGHYELPVLRQLCEIEAVVGVKVVTWDTQEFEDTVEALSNLGSGFRIYTGNDNVMYYNFIAGADGTLLGAHNAYAELIISMFDAVQRGDYEKAVRLHNRQHGVTRLLFSSPPMKYRSRYKAAAMLQGKLSAARLRPPLPEVGEPELDAIKKCLDASQLLGPYQD